MTASEQMASQLRARIVRGDWQPGSHLSARVELISELGSCANVVQDAAKQLVAAGFLEVGRARRARG